MGGLRALIDTSVLIGGTSHAEELGVSAWAVSTVSIGELQAGVLLAEEAEARAGRLRRLSAVLAAAPVLPVDQYVAMRYGELRAASGRAPTNDLWIAATALSHELTLLTADAKQASLPLVATQLVT